jgi:hypothetical protein
MPGTGPLRRSSGPARKKAIVGKSRVAAGRLQSPASVFGGFPSRCTFWSHIGPLEADGFGIDPAQQQLGKPDFKLLVFNGLEAHRPPCQARADKELVVGPVDFAILVDSPRDHPGIVQLLHPAAIGPSRMVIKLTPDNAFQGLRGGVAR